MKLHINNIFITCALGALPLVSISAALPEDSTKAEIAYGAQEAWKNTAAVSTVTSAQLMKTTSPSFGNSLNGLLSGLTVMQQSGEPGNDFSLQNLYARGQSTFVGNQKMLVMIDGYESTLDYISEEEIESVTLLKDAAALALYGGKGANGILLVTTKKGRISVPEISVRMQMGIQTPTVSNSPISSYDYARLYNQALANDGLSPRYSEADLTAYRMGSNQYLYPNVDWRKELLKKSAPLMNAEMSFRGGSDVIRYYVMAGMLQNHGLYKGADSKHKESSNVQYTRFNFRANMDVNISDAFMASLYASGAVGDLLRPGGDYSAYNLFSSIWQTAPNAFSVKNPNGTWGGNASFTNPVAELLNRGIYKENSRTLQVIFSLKYDFSKFVKGLSVSTGVNYNNYVADTSPKTRNYARYSLASNGVDDENNPVYAYTQYGVDEPLTSVEGFRTDNNRLNFKTQVDYHRVFSEHGLDATALFLTDIYKVYGQRYDKKYLNYAGRVGYQFRKTYLAEFSVSYMGSDNFAPKKRYGFFPSISAGWIISNEAFMSSAKWIDYLKIRSSYGEIGNDQTEGRYLFDARYAGRGSYLFGVGNQTSSGFGEITLANTDVTWERKRVWNFGLDAQIAKHFTIGFDLFHEVQQDILAVPYSSTLGFVGASYGEILPMMNIGKVTNKGFELNMGYKGNIGNSVRYFVNGGTWYAHNKVEEMGEDVKSYDYLYNRGNSVGRPIVLFADGLYQSSDFEADGKLKDGFAVPQYGIVKPGDVKYIDQNGDHVIDGNDSYPVGYSNLPELNYQFRFGLEYKGFDFSAFFHGVAHRDIYLSGAQVFSFVNNGTASRLALDSWSEENTNASYPRLSTMNFDNNYRTSTYWKRNGAYFRLRNLVLGYNVPQFFCKKVKLSNIYVYFNAVNLFTIDHLDGVGDPEMGNLSSYPLMKSYNMGLKLTF